MRRPSVAILLCLLLAACATGPGRPSAPAAALSASGLGAEYSALAKAGGSVYELDPAASEVRIFVFRGGTLAALGHNHVLSAPRFEGFCLLPKSGPSHARFDLVFRLDQLTIDGPAAVAQAGAGFASGLGPDDIAAVRRHMLGEANLQADRYPYVRVRSLEIVGTSPEFAAKVAVELHGQTQTMWLPLSVHIGSDRLEASGAFVLRQTDFGVHPYSVLGGLLAVQDPLVVRFTLVGHRMQSKPAGPGADARRPPDSLSHNEGR